MAFCIQCGAKLDEGSRFCSTCGHATAVAQPQVPVQASAPALPATGKVNEEFTNASGDYIGVTEEGIICRNTMKNRFYPYGSIDKIGFSLGSLDIMGKTNGEPKAFVYVAADKQQKSRLKDLVSEVKNKMRGAAKTDVVEIEPKKTVEQAQAEYKAHLEEKRAQEYIELHREIRMKCNVCGHIFCYTKQDLKDNQRNAAMAGLSGVGAIAAAIGGTGLDMYAHSAMADRNAAKVVDYSRCPSCRSTNLVPLSDEESPTPVQNTEAPAVSPVEEIKKYKELLDMGILTQEEFDTKKKQLLGL